LCLRNSNTGFWSSSARVTQPPQQRVSASRRSHTPTPTCAHVSLSLLCPPLTCCRVDCWPAHTGKEGLPQQQRSSRPQHVQQLPHTTAAAAAATSSSSAGWGAAARSCQRQRCAAHQHWCVWCHECGQEHTHECNHKAGDQHCRRHTRHNSRCVCVWGPRVRGRQGLRSHFRWQRCDKACRVVCLRWWSCSCRS
jgi:hypothetical protein